MTGAFFLGTGDDWRKFRDYRKEATTDDMSTEEKESSNF